MARSLNPWKDKNHLTTQSRSIFIHLEMFQRDGAFAFIIEDDSMTPKFLPDDLVMVDPAIKPKPGEIV